MAAKKKNTVKSSKKIKYQFLVKFSKDLELILIPAILFVTLMILGVYANSIRVKASGVSFASKSFNKPVEGYASFSHPINPQISAEAAIIMDRDAKTMLYTKNPNIRFSMASTTKIMTALVAMEYFKSEDILTTITSNVEGVNVGIEVGDRLYFNDALYAMLLPSGNDIAYLIAQNYPGGEDAFVLAMNKKAADLHLSNTHYADPAGLNDDGNYTTAYELAHLAAIVSQDPTISEVMSTKSKIIQTVDGSKIFTLTNLNELLGEYGVIGMKTGHTEGAGDVLITSAIEGGRCYIIIVMRSVDRFADTQILLSSLISSVSVFYPRVFYN